MALITSLTVDRDKVCEGESITLHVETVPPDEPVNWFSAREGEAFKPAGDLNDKELPLVAGTHGFMARTDSDMKSITVRAVGLRLEFEPDNASEPWVIGPAPKMPIVTAKAIGINGAVSVITWKVASRFFADEFCPIAPSGLRTNFDFPQTGTENPITLDFGDVVRGRVVSVLVRAEVDGCRLAASSGNKVVGENPLQSEIETALPHTILRAIACKESGQRQFDAVANGGRSACPLFANLGKVGVMGIRDPSDDEIWNWRSNVAKGIKLFNGRIAQAREYPRRVRESEEFQSLVREFNERRAAEGLAPIQIELPDFTSGNLNDDPQQLELDAIRGYDGWEGEDQFGFELHEFRVALVDDSGSAILEVVNVDPVTSRGEAVWERVPIADRPAGDADPNYVTGVIALLGGCGSDRISPPLCNLQIITPFGTALGIIGLAE